jgi:lipoprotein-anchoring transpeptidase ErfK/SrfK
MPLIAYFSAQFNDARVLQAATKVTANGKPLTGGRWFFERVWNHPGYPIEGDYRLDSYWPAHAQIRVTIAAQGLYAGPGFGFDNSLTSTFTTGPSHVAVVDGATHRLTLYTDGKVAASYPVALGKPGHATLSGIKVIMERVSDTEMKGQGYDVPDVKWDERLTVEGEYLHSAPWNIYNIEHGIDSSHGCTNLRPDDALALYNTLRVGDVVSYAHIQEATTAMTMGDGYGDWDVSWAQWSGGGAIPTR